MLLAELVIQALFPRPKVPKWREKRKQVIIPLMTPSRRLRQKQLAASVQALHPNANLMPCLISVVTHLDAEASNGRAHKHPSLLLLDSKMFR